MTMLAVAGCKTTPPEEEKKGEAAPQPGTIGAHASLLKLLPSDADIGDWKTDGAARVFGPAAVAAEGMEAIEADLGQAAAAYRAYGYVRSAVRHYIRGAEGERVTVRLFEMKTPSEAFGIFSVRSSGGTFPLVGLAARMGSKVLGFVKGAYFASIEYAGVSDATPVLMDFGRWMADQITSPGYRPAVLETFPLGSAQGERYYLHRFETLAGLAFVPKGDPTTMARMLDLSDETDVAIMGYPTETAGVLNYLFVIRYPSAVDAGAAYTAYDGYLSNSTSAAEQNVAVAPPVGSYVAGTFNAEENSVRDQLAKLLTGLGG
ncbi:MAG: hypothetical protein AMK72_13625 [Planctomycetes bacterium SM23_25]|nr:MAG: hypothetical protein AMK72_13625 [Planctomycetes bacterium SM23_25]